MSFLYPSKRVNRLESEWAAFNSQYSSSRSHVTADLASTRSLPLPRRVAALPPPTHGNIAGSKYVDVRSQSFRDRPFGADCITTLEPGASRSLEPFEAPPEFRQGDTVECRFLSGYGVVSVEYHAARVVQVHRGSRFGRTLLEYTLETATTKETVRCPWQLVRACSWQPKVPAPLPLPGVYHGTLDRPEGSYVPRTQPVFLKTGAELTQSRTPFAERLRARELDALRRRQQALRSCHIDSIALPFSVELDDGRIV